MKKNLHIEKLATEALAWATVNHLFITSDVSRQELFNQRFAQLLVQEALGIWECMDNGNPVEGYCDMEDYPRAVLAHFNMNIGSNNESKV